MRESVLRRRLPVIILLSILTITTFIDWSIDLQSWYGTPARITAAWKAVSQGDFATPNLTTLFTSLTCAFFHGDLNHWFGNLLIIWIFGVVICELAGWRWLVGVFLLTAIGATAGHVMMDPGNIRQMLGASGGLMGLVGFYFGLAMQHPRPSVEVWPISGPVSSGQLAAFAFVSVAFDIMGITDGGQGIAYGAHLGGFATGVILSVIGDRVIR